MRKLFFLLLLVGFSGVGQAADPTPFDKKWSDQVEPFYKTGVFGAFSGEANVTIRYAAFRHATSDKAIVLVPGFSESYLKYKEFIYDLNRLGFSVYTMDHRGQGYSQRLVANPSMIHLDKFEYLPKDLETFVRLVVEKEHKGRVFVYAHSMGGLVAAHVLHNRKVKIEAAILNAPLFEMNLFPLPLTVAKNVTGLQLYRGKGAEFAPGVGAYDEKERTNFAKHKTSRSRARFDKLAEQVKHNPEIQVGGPSNQWVHTMLVETPKFQALAKNVRTPVLLLQAGDEKLVGNGGQTKVCKLMVNCALVKYPGARHELWREMDAVREDVLQRVVKFFK